MKRRQTSTLLRLTAVDLTTQLDWAAQRLQVNIGRRHQSLNSTSQSASIVRTNILHMYITRSLTNTCTL